VALVAVLSVNGEMTGPVQLQPAADVVAAALAVASKRPDPGGQLVRASSSPRGLSSRQIGKALDGDVGDVTAAMLRLCGRVLAVSRSFFLYSCCAFLNSSVQS